MRVTTPEMGLALEAAAAIVEGQRRATAREIYLLAASAIDLSVLVASAAKERDSARAELDVERTMHGVTHDALMSAQRDLRDKDEALAILRRELPGAGLVDAARYVVNLVVARRFEVEQLHAAAVELEAREACPTSRTTPPT